MALVALYNNSIAFHGDFGDPAADLKKHGKPVVKPEYFSCIFARSFTKLLLMLVGVCAAKLTGRPHTLSKIGRTWGFDENDPKMTKHNFYKRGCANWDHKKFLSEISFGRTCVQCVRLGAPLAVELHTSCGRQDGTTYKSGI